MNEKNRVRTMELVTPVLRQGERVELVCTPNVGTVSVKRQVATSALVGLARHGDSRDPAQDEVRGAD